ncbi:hypothetical protein [Nitrosomonas marina]|uniref:hypothetical protein n=1 Tax=Nitrosomonas marina TaxID=917 RepID=UPI000B837125|nr:hypothetical protein [Nitrosomonas marina]
MEEYDRLTELARIIKGRMIISVNDIPEMRRAFNGLTMDVVSINHTVGGLHGRDKRNELVIRNF